uniref:ZF-HD homeobox protein n=1 Tax=Saccharum hybrid cultivar R570 TaxID=131158 RepID=A0A059Q1Q9_9POAL|nr:ZF-HD homeobox protein [Saccharum hybrid cultivar R570]
MEFRGQEGDEPVSEEMGASSAPPPALALAPAPAPASGNQNHTAEARYHECLRNHAAALGGHVVDGCGEFMPGGDGDRLKCAACGCHRSFHRKDDARRRHQLLLPAPAPVLSPTTPAPRVPLLLPPPHPHYAAHPHYAPPPFPYHGTPSGSGGGTTTESSSEERGPPSGAAAQAQAHGHVRRKRFRTKFTPEQKEQMLAFAERLGWRMQKQDDALVQHFCDQVGVRLQVFKVWMHNNKHIGSGGRRQPPPQGQQQSPQQPQPQAHQQPQQEQ